MRKEKKKRKAKRKEKKGGRNKKKKNSYGERKEKEKEGKRERENFPAFGRLKFNSLRTKVGARSTIYVWTPKSWSFDKLREVGVFLLLGLFLI